MIALVPIKEHSERIINKNIRKFNGKPLYHWIIESLLASEYIKKIYINTDSKYIISEAPRMFERLEIIERPENIRGDFVSMNDIIAYDLSKINNEYFLQTHATNPLLETKTINRAIETFFALQANDSLFSVNKLNSRLYDADGKAINHSPHILARTQDLAPIYEENSNLYIFSKKSFAKKHNRIGESPFLFEMNIIEAIDIDIEEEFRMAETFKRVN